MQGKCLCGAVSIEAKDCSSVNACHCGMCRRWGGGPLLVVHAGTDIKINQNTTLVRFNSSDWAERGFCNQCGTHLFYFLKPTNEYMLPVGLFQETSNFKFEQQIFIDKKPEFYEFSNQTENLTEQQVFEKYT